VHQVLHLFMEWLWLAVVLVVQTQQVVALLLAQHL
jgi:hypothetical protein